MALFSSKKKKGTDSAKKQVKKKTAKQELIELAIIAFIIVPTINIFVLQSYAIPTSSMEAEMLVGDKLFVSKLHYGPRIPITPIAFPYVHNSFFGTKSYTEAITFPYMRIPGFSSLKRNDIVVFNYPPDGKKDMPVDRRTNYVKRCVSVAGDSISIKKGEIFINGKPGENLRNLQHMYAVSTSSVGLNKKTLRKLDISESIPRGNGNYIMMLSANTAEELKKIKSVVSVDKVLQPEGEFNPRVYPHSADFPWNIDNYGPLYIPKEGDKIPLNKENYTLYETAIREYEGFSTLKWENDRALINGKPAESHTFKFNYYFMMGDNRHNSEDSRYWGIVPEDHVVGKPVFVWLSTDKNAKGFGDWIRWDKSFRFVK